MLGLHEGRDQIDNQKEWEEEENNVGFHPPKWTPRYLGMLEKLPEIWRKLGERTKFLRGWETISVGEWWQGP